jgi:hypothetical protein
MNFNVPILLLIYNRQETTIQVLNKLQELKPKALYIAADGGKSSEDKLTCEKLQHLVLQTIDWDCNVNTNFQSTNLGSGKHISNALNWFFSQVEEGIILEDDCVPNIDFFKFCSVNLKRYKDDNSVSAICGSNLQYQKQKHHFFSKYFHGWGWATWKRFWELYDFDIINKTNLERDILRHYDFTNQEIDYWNEQFKLLKNGKVDAWDFQFQLTCWLSNTKNLIPSVNLVTNIGFNEKATHTKQNNLWFANKINCDLGEKTNLPPKSKEINFHLDRKTFERVYFNPIKFQASLNLTTRDKFYLFRKEFISLFR